MKTLCPACTSRRAMCAPILPRPMKPMSMTFLPQSLCVHCSGHEFAAHPVGMLADCGYRPVMARGGGAGFGRGRVRYRAAWCADGDAAQVRMPRKIGRRVDARKSDI